MFSFSSLRQARQHHGPYTAESEGTAVDLAVDPGPGAGVLELDEATVRYPDGEGTITALAPTTLRVRRGECVVVVGESGSGKSTLLSVAGLLQPPTSGEVRVNGLEAPPAQIRREHIGFVFQQHNLLQSLTAKEQLLVTDHLRGARQDAERAEALLDRVGVPAHRRVAELSGGQRQRVNLARALMGNPSLLLADEPTSALDATRSRQIVGLLRELATEHQLATLLVTHDRSQLGIADRVLEMRDGEVRELR